ncbi:GNAT family N-acetyltransferase [Lysobacter sp. GCM10012299]
MTASSRYFTPSDIESARFGLTVARARLDESSFATAATLHEELRGLRADVGILRVPAGSTAIVHALAREGLPIVHADTLVYYTRDLSSYTPPAAAPAGVEFGEARSDEIDAIAALARRSFGDYRSHYHANPRFDPVLVSEGYAQWACAHLEVAADGRHTHVARIDSKVIAFLTSTESDTDSSVEILLNAVCPAHARMGVYSALFGSVLEHFRDRGLATVRISTQIWNYAVQRVWARHGLAIERAYDTFHINLT